MNAPIDFQSEENRWAAEMACAEANARGATYIVDDIAYVGALYALAIRILRTETRPVDPLLKRAREIVANYLADSDREAYMSGENDRYSNVQIALAALKERGV